ncbi:MAG: hypothetical protein K0R46_1830, partial [Herbinix sp.]|nr:hypothetical protein [Herbinix sp.]
PDAKEFPCNSCDNTLNHWEQEIDKPDQGEALPCDTCGREIQGCCDYPNTEDNYCVNGDKWQPIEPEPVETIEADIIQTVPESDEEDEPEVIDPEYYSYHDVNTEIDKLTEYIEAFRKNNDTVPGRRKAKMRYDAIILLDKEMRKPQVIEEPKPVQPELPILKNNDQRKEWAENYKTWGEWYYEQHVDCYYYKYDFPNGDRLVVEEYRERELYWKAGTHDEQHYHLLQKNKEAYGSKRTYEKKYDHTTSSMSEITDYLKDLQKK